MKPDEVMKMRFVLTWKTDPSVAGGKKAKARLVVLGFQDPRLGQEETLAPTMQKRSRTILFFNAVQNRWKVWKADVKSAFLQGKSRMKKNNMHYHQRNLPRHSKEIQNQYDWRRQFTADTSDTGLVSESGRIVRYTWRVQVNG